MCCFSRPVRHVAKTKIFARGEPDGRQVLAYAMDVEIREDLAMVLPLPVPAHPAEDAVRFIDLEGYADFFVDLERAFPAMLVAQASRGFGPPLAAAPKLVVHDVGMFEASFVPTVADFARLDERFRLPDEVWHELPRYADWGFAVFKLKAKKGVLGLGSKEQSVHPMAFSFPRRDPRHVFFPTVHVHDGHVADRAAFDHSLYAQLDGVIAETIGWTPSHGALGQSVNAARSRGLVDGSRGGHTTMLLGDLPNDDVWLREPDGLTVDELRGGGVFHAYTVRGRSAFSLRPAHDMEAAWTVTSRRSLGAIARALREELPRLLEREQGAWHLARLTDALPPHFMNGPKLWTGTTYMDGAPVTSYGPGRVHFTPFTKRVEPQDVTIGFSRVPDEPTLAQIQAALRAVLDGAVS